MQGFWLGLLRLLLLSVTSIVPGFGRTGYGDEAMQ